ncbi:MAG: hypothetical protein LBQ94_03940 [Treponema sp.]|nr:hypothetical protein [Treponema sp.]
MKKLNLFFLLGLVFFSCASAPKVSIPEDVEGAAEVRELYMLPAGGKAYIWIDTAEARPLIDVLSIGGLSGKDMARIIDSTETAVAAMFPEGEDRSFFLAATGKFPVFAANFSMTFSRDWKKQKSPNGSSYWYSKSDGIALALGSNLALVSNIDPFAAFTAEIPPPGFAEFRRDFALAGWMPNPSETVDSVIASMGVPLQIPAEGLFFGASRLSPNPASTDNPTDDNPMDDNSPDTELWAPVFKIRTPSASHARSLLALFSVARLFIQRGLISPGAGSSSFMSPQEAAALLFANTPEQDDDFLIIRTAPIEAASVALLFQMFSIYSE